MPIQMHANRVCFEGKGDHFMAFSIKDFSDIQKLGEGGMGNVYLATQVALDRRVVIKELTSTSQKDPKLIKRFENEAKSAAGLDHDNIIKVFDFGEDRHSFFISMEYVDGLDLEQLMHWKPFPREIGLMILLQAMKGLNYAHDQGIVHCDVKPGNILVSKTGKVKVVDFGLAHASIREAEYMDKASVFITPGYMPPEVASGNNGENVLMDIWSTGVLAYRIICGMLPFASDDIRKLIFSIVHEKEKDVQSIVPTLPEDLSAAVRACLEKNPRKRPATLDNMIESLENYIYDLGVRNVEKMIMNYIGNKDSSETEIAGMLLQYHMQKGNEYLDAGNSAKSEAHFREAEKYGVVEQSFKISPMRRQSANPKTRFSGQYPQRLDSRPANAPKERKNFPLGQVLAKVKNARAMIPIIGVSAIVLLGAILAFMMVRNNGNRGTQPARDAVLAAAEGVRQNQVKRPPGGSEADREPVPGMAALNQELTSVDKYKAVSTEPVQTRRTNLEPSLAGTTEVRRQGLQKGEQKYGVLKLSVEPSSASVFVDGEKVTVDQLAGGKRLSAGRHTVAAYANGYGEYKTTVTVEPNARQAVSVAMKPLESGTGMLHVHSYPWADLFVDDVYQGTTPTPTPISLAVGDHVIVLKRAGFSTYSGKVHVDRGETTRIKIQMEQ
jgi:serine/threonine protein kinase